MNNNHKEKSIEELEIQSWKKKLIGAWALTIPIAIIMYSAKLGLFMIDDRIMTVILLILAFPVIFIFGFATIKSGLKGFTNFYFNMD